MIAIEALEKLMVELNENGYKSHLMIEPLKNRLTLCCSMKDEDTATLARRTLPATKEKEKTSGFRARPF